MTIRHRTTVPDHVDFDGWWVRSPKGTEAQLNRIGRDVREHYLYHLLFSNGQEGNGTWTIEQLLEAGAVIRVEKKALVHPTNGSMAKQVRARASKRESPKEERFDVSLPDQD